MIYTYRLVINSSVVETSKTRLPHEKSSINCLLADIDINGRIMLVRGFCIFTGVMANRKVKFRPFLFTLLALALAGGIYLAMGFYHGAVTLHEMLTENKQLKQAISNLTFEDQIGYAKVVDQNVVDGRLMTKLLFVQTSPVDKFHKIMEKQYAIEGDVVYFDAMIVKFQDQMVIEGQTRAMYIWRRVFGEKMAPGEGFSIEKPGLEPERYKDLLSMLSDDEQQVFWRGLWELAEDPDRLEQYGIRAVYGNAVYTRLRPGLIYIFKITAAGQVFREVIPDI